MSFPDGSSLEGEFLKNEIVSGTFTWATGEVFYGGFKNGKREGEGKLILSDGVEYIGEFKDGDLHGTGKLSAANFSYEGDWRRNVKEGKGTMYLPEGDTVKGNFENDQLSGYCVYTHKKENITFKGHISDGKRNGNGMLFGPHGSRYDGPWKDNLRHGDSAEYMFEDGHRFVGAFKEDEPQNGDILQTEFSE